MVADRNLTIPADLSRILVIGATGFTGRRVVHFLTENTDAEVTCLVRQGTTPPDTEKRVTIVRGDLSDPESLAKALAGKDGVIYVASLGFGHAPAVIKACEESGIKKAVFTSTTAIFTQLNAPSKIMRTAAENAIQASALNWTILRPTMIYGRKGDRNMERLVKLLKWCPVLPVPGGGTSLQQPVHVDDVAAALVQAYASANTVRKAYNISGKTPLTFKEVVAEVAKQLGKKAWVLPLPLKPCRIALRLLEKALKKPWLKEEQLLRLNEDKSFSHAEAEQDFAYTPRSFTEGVKILLQTLHA